MVDLVNNSISVINNNKTYIRQNVVIEETRIEKSTLEKLIKTRNIKWPLSKTKINGIIPPKEIAIIGIIELQIQTQFSHPIQ